MLASRQKGFTLVELMVAMAIGTIIILGAGQLFLTTFQTFRTVEELSRKQETVIFAANTLVNAYRSGGTGYTLEATKDSDGNELDECSIIDTKSQARPQPIVGGLATFGDECNTDRFFSPDENISGYYTFTLDFKRGGEELEILEFHVMDRNTATGGSDPNEYQVSTGDAIIAGGALSGVGSDLLQGDSRTSSNMFSYNIPDPRSGGGDNSTGYIENFKNLDDVVATCDAATISTSTAKKFYCNSNINNLSVDGLSKKIIVAEDGISLSQNGNTSVNELAIVAGGAVNINGSNSTGAEFEGVIWSGGSSNLSASGVDFKGSVVAGGAVSVNNASSITADWNTWAYLSVSGYEFSMADKFGELGAQINEAEKNE